MGFFVQRKDSGFTLIELLVVVAIIITFNTIRLAIYTSRDEIAVKRLVGATRRHVRMPFIVGGALYGAISAVITMAIFYPITLVLGPATERFFGGPDIFNYYLSNFFGLFLILSAVGVILGVISSSVATRRYLKI